MKPPSEATIIGLKDLEKLRADLARAVGARDAAYAERNQVLALMARMAVALGWPVGVATHPESDTNWEADWRTILVFDLPTGQASWHFHDSERERLAGLPQYEKPWDGHSTPAKYDRVNAAMPIVGAIALATERTRAVGLLRQAEETLGPISKSSGRTLEYCKHFLGMTEENAAAYGRLNDEDAAIRAVLAAIRDSGLTK